MTHGRSQPLELVNLSGFMATLALKEEKMEPFVEFSLKNGYLCNLYV